MRGIALAGLAGLAALGFAQTPDFGGREQASKMKALDFLVGRWEGTATLYAPGGRTMQAKGYENVRMVAGGTCVAIDARWVIDGGDREIPIHEPAAMIVYDNEKKEYWMTTQLANGLRNQFQVQVKPNGFVWMLNHPQSGEVRYTMNLSEAGEWVEVGEHKNKDGQWEKLLEMRLKKVSKSN